MAARNFILAGITQSRNENQVCIHFKTTNITGERIKPQERYNTNQSLVLFILQINGTENKEIFIIISSPIMEFISQDSQLDWSNSYR